MKTKKFQAPIEFKADEEKAGTFQAIFSRFNIIDHDGDVVLPGAIEAGTKVRISYWGHRWQDLPVGRGVIHTDSEKAWVDGELFLSTEGGRETHETLKGLGDLAEFSYGFDVEEAERGIFEGEPVQFLKRLTLFEVSPVMLGATPDTALLAIKSAKEEHKGRPEPVEKDDDEGEAVDDGKPSGVSPDVIVVQIELLELED
jgi:HK97 family phage prohead protease